MMSKEAVQNWPQYFILLWKPPQKTQRYPMRVDAWKAVWNAGIIYNYVINVTLHKSTSIKQGNITEPIMMMCKEKLKHPHMHDWKLPLFWHSIVSLKKKTHKQTSLNTLFALVFNFAMVSTYFFLISIYIFFKILFISFHFFSFFFGGGVRFLFLFLFMD